MQYKKLVMQVYRERPRSRVSDPILVAHCYAHLIGINKWEDVTLRDFLLLVYYHKCPTPDTLARMGRWLRSNISEFKLSKEEEARKKRESEVTKEDLGYHVRKGDDPEQLPLFGELL